MALLSTLVKAIADVEGLDEVQVGWIARYLREAGLITQAGRGRGAAHMKVVDAVHLLIGVNGSSSAKQAVEAVHRFSRLQLRSNAAYMDEYSWGSEIDRQDAIEKAFVKDTLLSDALGYIIQAHIPDANGLCATAHAADILIVFTRPNAKCSICLGDNSNPDDPELYQQGTFSNTLFDLEPEELPDKTDSTMISSRTLRAIGKVLAT
ncbi:hypothetical protein [Methylobacterium sp. CM6244]